MSNKFMYVNKRNGEVINFEVDDSEIIKYGKTRADHYSDCAESGKPISWCIQPKVSCRSCIVFGACTNGWWELKKKKKKKQSKIRIKL